MRIVLPVDGLLVHLFPETSELLREPAAVQDRLRDFYGRGTTGDASVHVEEGLAIIDVATDPPPEEARATSERAAALIRQGRHAQAARLLAPLVEQHPTVSVFHGLLGRALVERRQHELAHPHLLDAVRWDPDNADALLLLGDLKLTRQDDLPAAIALYERAFAAVPADAGGPLALRRALSRALRAHYAGGRYLEAFEQTVEALKLVDESPLQPYATRLASQTAHAYGRHADALPIVDRYRRLIEQACGKRVETARETPDGRVAAKLEVAETYGRDRHVIKYKKDAPHYAHLVMHELVHLDFITQARKAGTNKLFTANERLKQRFFQDAEKAIMHLRKQKVPADAVDHFAVSLFEGINSQMYNAPIDLFIEAFLYASFPELRPIQFASLYRMLADFAVAATDRDVRALSPRHVYEANVVLNLTHALQFRDLFGIDLSPDFRAPRTLRRAQSFYAEYEEIKDDRRPGEEYELIQDWAEDLQVDAYFELVNESPLRPQRDVLSDIEADPLNLLDPERKSNRLSLASSPAGAMAVTMYLVDAINLFAEQERDFIQRVSFEISMLGTYGLDPSDPERKYSLKSLPGRKFSALQLLAILYAGMSALDPSVDTGLDFGDEYTLAKKLAGMPAK